MCVVLCLFACVYVRANEREKELISFYVSFLLTHTHTHTHTHIYIYIYIYRERERERDVLGLGRMFSKYILPYQLWQ